MGGGGEGGKERRRKKERKKKDRREMLNFHENVHPIFSSRRANSTKL